MLQICDDVVLSGTEVLGNAGRELKFWKEKATNLQIQKDVPTIEGKLFEAMLKLGWITQENIDHPITVITGIFIFVF